MTRCAGDGARSRQPRVKKSVLPSASRSLVWELSAGKGTAVGRLYACLSRSRGTALVSRVTDSGQTEAARATPIATIPAATMVFMHASLPAACAQSRSLLVRSRSTDGGSSSRGRRLTFTSLQEGHPSRGSRCGPGEIRGEEATELPHPITSSPQL